MSKNTHVWPTQWPTSSGLKIKFDPSLDRSWCEFFKIMKNHGPKNPHPGCNLSPEFFPLSHQISVQQLLSECSILEPSFSNLTGLLQVNNTSGSFLPMHNKASMLLTFIAAELILRWRKRWSYDIALPLLRWMAWKSCRPIQSF